MSDIQIQNNAKGLTYTLADYAKSINGGKEVKFSLKKWISIMKVVTDINNNRSSDNKIFSKGSNLLGKANENFVIHSGNTTFTEDEMALILKEMGLEITKTKKEEPKENIKKPIEKVIDNIAQKAQWLDNTKNENTTTTTETKSNSATVNNENKNANPEIQPQMKEVVDTVAQKAPWLDNAKVENKTTNTETKSNSATVNNENKNANPEISTQMKEVVDTVAQKAPWLDDTKVENTPTTTETKANSAIANNENKNANPEIQPQMKEVVDTVAQKAPWLDNDKNENTTTTTETKSNSATVNNENKNANPEIQPQMKEVVDSIAQITPWIGDSLNIENNQTSKTAQNSQSETSQIKSNTNTTNGNTTAEVHPPHINPSTMRPLLPDDKKVQEITHPQKIPVFTTVADSSGAEPPFKIRAYKTGSLGGGTKTISREFHNKLMEIANRLNCNYEDLLAVMNSESSIDPEAAHKNKRGKTTAIGLIQFTKKGAIAELNKTLGMNLTIEKIEDMDAIEQLDLVEKYLTIAASRAPRIRNKSKLDGADLYSLVYLPGRAGRDILCEKGERDANGRLLNYYEKNYPLDVGNDGIISRADILARLEQFRVNVIVV